MMSATPFLPGLFAGSSDYAAIPEGEAVAALAEAIRRGSGRWSREAEGYLASVAAEVVLDRLAERGLEVVRRVHSK